ncbi:MAG: hypothetical protein ACOC02_01145 [Guyparkeria sp.]|uniref:hypothetical protein n=1 Tax=Guyparkeria sp. TaxID=2035736 RepID=UPI003977F373
MSQPSTDCRIEDKVAFLSRPEAYGDEHPERIEVIETHMSWVFLTERHAYKLKKPVRYAFLDFSTLEARGRDCAAEVRLNRRLAPDTYLGALPLNLDDRGQLTLGDGGRIVDWVVKMRRLPADRMLDRVIRERRLHPADITAVAEHLAAFYSRCEPVVLSPESYRARLRKDITTNLEALSEPLHEPDNGQLDRIRSALLGLLAREPGWFDARASGGHVVEGHGDLRPEHVCLERPPVIFDCLEFDRRLRTLDAADDLAFLAMECDRLEAPEVGETLYRVYGERCGDWPDSRLIAFYKSRQACLRAKLAIWHIFELPTSEWEPWRQKARDYLALAEEQARQCE